MITSFNNRIRKETSAQNILGENVIFNLNYLVVSGILLEREREREREREYIGYSPARPQARNIRLVL